VLFVVLVAVWVVVSVSLTVLVGAGEVIVSAGGVSVMVTSWICGGKVIGGGVKV